MAKHQRVAPHESRCLQCLAVATKKFRPDPMGGFFGVGREVFFWESLLFGECQRLTWMSVGSDGKRLGSVVGITPIYAIYK